MRRDRWAASLVIAAAMVLGWQPRALGQDKGAFEFSPLVLPGTPSPDGATYFPCKDCGGQIQGPEAFNTSGIAGIEAVTQGPCFDGFFLVSPGSGSLLASFCASTIVGKPGLLGGIAMNERGDTALLTGPIDSENFIDPAILVYSGGQVRVAAKSGDPTTGGWTDIGPLSKKCIFGEPFINSNGDVSFWGCTVDDSGMQHFGIFSASGGKVTVVASDEDPTPVGAVFSFFAIPPFDAINNDNGQVLFQAGVFSTDPEVQGGFGLFLWDSGTVKKILLNGNTSGDMLGQGYAPLPGSLPVGMLNNNGDVAICTGLDLSGGSDTGVFLYQAGLFKKIVVQGGASPIGGQFGTFADASLADMVLGGLERPELNDSDEVVFKAKSGPDGKTPGLFMASPNTIVKIVAVGDVLPNGERIGEIKTYALNQTGQVAFFAYRKKGELGPLGVWVASPVQPSIKKAKLKGQLGALQLVVKGSGFITNDSVIEINGTALGRTTYPPEFQQNGGTATRLISTDAALDQLVPPGSMVQVTVLNRLTGLLSASFSLTR